MFYSTSFPITFQKFPKSTLTRISKMKQVNTLSKNKQQAKINPLPLLQNQYHAAAAAAADDDDDDDDDDGSASWYSYLLTQTKRERLLFFALWLSFTPLPSSCANVTMLLNVVHNMATLSDIQ